MAKEKFELMFLGGGVMLDALSRRLRRPPATPREAVGAAVYRVERALDACGADLPEPGAALAPLRVVREELCAAAPSRDVLDASLDELADLARPVDGLSESVDGLRAEIARLLG